MSGWSWQHTDHPGVVGLHRGDGLRPVATVWWIHDPVQPASVMDRIVTSLNRPAIECAPSTDPCWTLTVVPCGGPNVIPAAWCDFHYAGTHAASIIWQVLPHRLDEWHQRILDALNPGHGLPAVTLPLLAGAR